MFDSIYTLPAKTESGLITNDEILAILSQYRIGKKPLSLLLGWGQTTILRYLSGVSPTVEYSKELRRIASDPAYYYQLLTNNMERLTEVAYRKSRNAVLTRLIGTRLNLIAQYIINRAGGDISAKRTQAILHYSQCFSLALRETALFDEDYQITSIQMPYPSVYESMRVNKCHVISIPDNALSPEDRSFIDSIYNALEWYGPEALRVVLASERLALHKGRTTLNAIKVVPKTTLTKYFQKMIQDYHIRKPSEINIYFNKRMAELRKKKGT